MEFDKRLAGVLPAECLDRAYELADTLTDIRMRSGAPIELCHMQGSELIGSAMTAERLLEAVSAMLDYSLYAWEDELRRGFFTLPGGFRVGVCGRYAVKRGEPHTLKYLSSACVRIAREVKGAAQALIPYLAPDGNTETPASILIISRPGMGKTTLLRDIARLMSESGYHVALADERGELASAVRGTPILDVGSRTDVMDMCPKHLAIAHMIRSMAPDIVMTDELGGVNDANAVLDAKRSGVAVVATAHANTLNEAIERSTLRPMLEARAFDFIVRLSGEPGRIEEVKAL